MLRFSIGICLLLMLMGVGVQARADTDVEKGRRIYMQGILPSGGVLKAVREGIELRGPQAACVSCHRPSGMGSVEGDIQIPPITGDYLYRLGDALHATMDLRSGKQFNQAHDPYTDTLLGRALRQGLNVGEHEMSVLMPRYALADDDLAALTAYLKQLSHGYSPGVTKSKIQFATVITPDADPERRRMLLSVLKQGISQKNGSTVVGDQRGGRRHMVTAAEMVLGTERNWQLHVWDLHGAPETWRAQLEEFYRKEPVFALLSGLSGSTWQPVHEFCESSKIPCWFPSVDLPVASGEDFYSVYFHKGVQLEAAVLAKFMAEELGQAPRRVVQIYRGDAVGEGASVALSSALKPAGIAVDNRPFLKFDADTLKSLFAGLDDRDAVMLWLDAADLRLLEGVPPTKATVYLSGRLSGGENSSLPASWKTVSRVVYPYELPDKRRVNLYYFHQWMRYNQIPVEDEALQDEAYFALETMSDTLTEMLDNIYRDYLVERAESMLSRADKSKIEQRDWTRQIVRWSSKPGEGRSIPGSKDNSAVADTQKVVRSNNYEKSLSKSTCIYPRMGLSVGQHFASKGAYIVRFDATSGNKLIPMSSWIVP